MKPLEKLVLSLPAEITATVKTHSDECGRVFLVGGAVRDYLDGQATQDFDFIVERNASTLARTVANQLKANFFFLDRQRDISRVLLDHGGIHSKFDFAVQADKSITGDLIKRDFTVNAMAIPLDEPGTLIDPLDGELDLNRRFLRKCSTDAIRAEPIRALRAVRFVVQNEFRLLPDTDASIREVSAELTRVSPERIRDEIFRILMRSNTTNAIRLMDVLGLLKPIFPELVALKQINPEMPSRTDTFGHTLHVLDFIENLACIQKVHKKIFHTNQHLIDDVLTMLNAFPIDWPNLFKTQISYDRTQLSLFKFAVLYHDTGKVNTKAVKCGPALRFPGHERESALMLKTRGKELKLSSREIGIAQKFVISHMMPRNIEHCKNEEIIRNLFRLIQSSGNATPLIAIFYPADVFGAYGGELSEKRWQIALNSSRLILDAWCNQKDRYINQTPYLNGTEIQNLLGIQPDSRTGRLRDLLLEAQVTGDVKNKTEAKNFIQAEFSNYFSK